mmetsp:Transcript_23442/g.76194  ORF Transcript_23442/g.76194 Transcript_23442/m.76194 type:complete len:284 (-) Transcript_23442:289-1140(-)
MVLELRDVIFEGQEATAAGHSLDRRPQEILQGPPGCRLSTDLLDRNSQPFGQNLGLLSVIVALRNHTLLVEPVDVTQFVLHLHVVGRLVLLPSQRSGDPHLCAARVTRARQGRAKNDSPEHRDDIDLHLMMNAGPYPQEQWHQEPGSHLLHLFSIQVLSQPDVADSLLHALVSLGVQVLDERSFNPFHDGQDVRVLSGLAALSPLQHLLHIPRLHVAQEGYKVLSIGLLHLGVRDGKKRRRKLQTLVRPCPILPHRLSHLLVIILLILSRPLLSWHPVDRRRG